MTLQDDMLGAETARVMTSVLDEEQAKREHVVVCLSGAHAYGFPSPDSDLDLKAIHIAPSRELLGLTVPRVTFDRMEVIDGVEIDYTSNEVAGVLAGLLKGNGNYLERIVGKLLPLQAPCLQDLIPLARGTISRRYYRHYRGFAEQQRQAFTKAERPTAKKVLYVLRTTLTGAHLLRSGQLRVDLNENLEDFAFSDALQLIERKRAGERTQLDEAMARHWAQRVQRAFELLEHAHDNSSLPQEPTNGPDLEAWLVEQRLARV